MAEYRSNIRILRISEDAVQRVLSFNEWRNQRKKGVEGIFYLSPFVPKITRVSFGFLMMSGLGLNGFVDLLVGRSHGFLVSRCLD
jgi:hypothetical protein